MSERQPDNRLLPSWLPKVFAISACTLCIGLGLCGLDAHLHPHPEFGDLTVLALFGFAVMVLAVLALLLVVLILLASLVSLMFPR